MSENYKFYASLNKMGDMEGFNSRIEARKYCMKLYRERNKSGNPSIYGVIESPTGMVLERISKHRNGWEVTMDQARGDMWFYGHNHYKMYELNPKTGRLGKVIATGVW